MDVQPSPHPFIDQDVIQRQAVSQLLRARLRATAGLVSADSPLPMATPTELSPLGRHGEQKPPATDGHEP
ncbi:hypothetical protein RYO59_002583 [Thermosynechococcaceae cyanobacterium Okahandja]